MILMTPVSIGEALDKMTILEIKTQRIHDPEKITNVVRELTELNHILQEARLDAVQLSSLIAELKTINEKLWDIEDRIREKEDQKDFGEEFISLARAVYQTNDKRASVKKQINILSGSTLIEEKSYAQDHEKI